MPIPKRQLFDARLRSVKATLENAEAHQKKGNPSVAMAENFNALLHEVGVAFPDIAAALPKPIPVGGMGWDLGLADASYLDLELFVDQIIALLDLVKE